MHIVKLVTLVLIVILSSACCSTVRREQVSALQGVPSLDSLCELESHKKTSEDYNIVVTALMIPGMSMLIDPDCSFSGIPLFNRGITPDGRNKIDRLYLDVLYSQTEVLEVKVLGTVFWFPDGKLPSLTILEYMDVRIVERPAISWLDNPDE